MEEGLLGRDHYYEELPRCVPGAWCRQCMLRHRCRQASGSDTVSRGQSDKFETIVAEYCLLSVLKSSTHSTFQIVSPSPPLFEAKVTERTNALRSMAENGVSSPELMETSDMEWGAAANLDLFFSRVYRWPRNWPQSRRITLQQTSLGTS